MHDFCCYSYHYFKMIYEDELEGEILIFWDSNISNFERLRLMLSLKEMWSPSRIRAEANNIEGHLFKKTQIYQNQTNVFNPVVKPCLLRVNCLPICLVIDSAEINTLFKQDPKVNASGTSVPAQENGVSGGYRSLWGKAEVGDGRVGIETRFKGSGFKVQGSAGGG